MGHGNRAIQPSEVREIVGQACFHVLETVKAHENIQQANQTVQEQIRGHIFLAIKAQHGLDHAGKQRVRAAHESHKTYQERKPQVRMGVDMGSGRRERQR